jgi:hypothetical protein
LIAAADSAQTWQLFDFIKNLIPIFWRVIANFMEKSNFEAARCKVLSGELEILSERLTCRA